MCVCAVCACVCVCVVCVCVMVFILSFLFVCFSPVGVCAVCADASTFQKRVLYIL